MTVIFDGRAVAQAEMAQLRIRVAGLTIQPEVVSFYFREDPGSVYYARYKRRWAMQVGIKFTLHEQTLSVSLEETLMALRRECRRRTRAGLIIQKPARRTFEAYFRQLGQPIPDFSVWWSQLVALIPLERDVDGLAPATQKLLKQGKKVLCLPATVRAVLKSLAAFDLSDKRILIIGRTDLLGWPLYYYWRQLGYDVTLVGKKELARLTASQTRLAPFQVLISAAGVPGLITGDLIAPETILVDVGEPQPDIERVSCEGKAAFLTPVPGGVGPLTVVSLLENSLILSESSRELEPI